MLYTAANVARHCSIYDVDTQQQVGHVISIDDERGEVEVVPQPTEMTASGDVATKKLSYRAIYPIRGGRHLPCLFHCYGRLESQRPEIQDGEIQSAAE